jgi:hypothetical protein
MKPTISAEGIMQFRRCKNALRRRLSIDSQDCQRTVAMVRPLAEKALKPHALIEWILGVERGEELGVHVQQFDGLFEISHVLQNKLYK